MQNPLFPALKITLLSFSLPLLFAGNAWARNCTEAEIDSYIEQFENRDQAALDNATSCGTQAIPALIKALEAGDSEIQNGAMIVLGNIGVEAIDPLIKALRSEDTDVRNYADGALVGIGKEAIPALIDALKDENQNAREGAADAIERIGTEAKDAVPALLKLLQDGNYRVRKRAASALGSVGGTNAVPTLLEVLNTDKSEWVRRSAAYALGLIHSRDAVPALIKALDDRSLTVRAYAAEALGNIGSEAKDAVPMLIKALASTDSTVRLSAATALGKIGLEAKLAIPSLIAALKDEDANTRSSAAISLSQIAEVLYDKAENSEQVEDAIKSVQQAQEALGASEEFEDSSLRVERTLKALNDQKKSFLMQELAKWILTGKNIWLVHATFWLALIFAYPKSPQIQAIFFWNPWVRKITGLGYVGFALTWIPFLRRKLFEPFRESLLADAALENFKPGAYFENSDVKSSNSGTVTPIRETIPSFKGQIVLEGASGLGKTMFLRHLCQQSQRVVVYLPATKCADGVIEAIQKKLHGEEIKDPKFLQNLIYSGAIAICIDGLNEVSADTRAKIVEFTENYFKGDIILATQPMEWTPPATAKRYVMQPLDRSRIQTFLLSRKPLIPDYAPVREQAYEQSCDRYLEQVLSDRQALEELEATQRILSNPMDLTVIASMLAAGKQPDLFRLQEQQYTVVTEEYREKHLRQEFPLDVFSEAVYQMRLNDQTALPEAQFLEELLGMERHKMVVSRQSQDREGKPAKEWYFRHDKIAEFFILQTFLEHPERQEQHLGDPRFRGVYFMLANFLKLEDAIALREMLIQYAADTKDHTVSDTFVQLLRSRKVELIQTAASG